MKQLPALSVDPNHKRTIILNILANARALYALVGMVSYLHYLVIEEDQAKMNEVGTSSYFKEALNRVRRLSFASFVEFCSAYSNGLIVFSSFSASLRKLRSSHLEIS